MYSVGQLQGYGYALLYGSLPGFVAAAAGHLLIYAFYVVAERRSCGARTSCRAFHRPSRRHRNEVTAIAKSAIVKNAG